MRQKLIESEKLHELIVKLLEENSRSLYLSALPGDFKKSRNRIDLAKLLEFGKVTEKKILALLEDHKKLLFGQSLIDYSDELETIHSALVFRKLKTIMEDQKSIQSERGYNALKIGYPLLVAKSKELGKYSFCAPLFMWPVKLTYEPSKKAFTLVRISETPEINPTLESHISTLEYPINVATVYEKLDEAVEEETITINDLIHEFLKKNNSVSTVDIERKLKKIPYEFKKDLESVNKPYEFELHFSPLLGNYKQSRINIINDLKTFTDGIPAISASKVKVADDSPIDMDPSQSGSIDDLNSGKHLVIHGPPGTGKSQTITGIITSAIAKGLKIAVVCQKVAALDVISSNLEKAGLRKNYVKIVDPTSDRKRVVDLVRSYEPRISNTNLKSPGKTSSRDSIQQASVKISKAEKALYHRDIALGQNWQSALARKLSLERESIESDSFSKEQKKLWLKQDEAGLEMARRVENLARQAEPLLKLHDDLSPKLAAEDIERNVAYAISQMIEIELSLTGIEEEKLSLNSHLDSILKESEKELKILKDAWDRISPTRETLSNAKDKVDSELRNVEDDQVKSEIVRLKSLNKNRDEDILKLKNIVSLGYDRAVSNKGFGNNFKRIFSSRFKQKQDEYLIIASKYERKFETCSVGLDVIIADSLGASDKIAKLSSFLQAKKEYSLALATVEEEIGLKLGKKEIDEAFGKVNKLIKLIEKGDFLSAEEFVETTSLKNRLNETESLIASFNDLNILKPIQSSIRKEDIPRLKSIAETLQNNLAAIHDYLELSALAKSLLISPNSIKPSFSLQVEHSILSEGLKSFTHKSSLFTNDGVYREVEQNTKRVKTNIKQIVKHNFDVHFNIGKDKIKNSRASGINTVFAKRGKNKLSLREIALKYQDSFTHLFPVLLTTPETLSNLFEGKRGVFDLIVFDEASQIELYDAVASLYKGKRIVVAGDEHQMPPSRFFMSDLDLDDLDVNEEEASINAESLLEFCRDHELFTSRFLDFHYRSEHPALISFSNSAFYQRLVPKPLSSNYKPFDFVHCPSGTFEKGVNEEEIQRVIQILSELPLDSKQTPKVLVATMNSRQKQQIEKSILEKEEEDELFADKISKLRGAGMSVKNLDGLQGDEADLLIISIGYGRSTSGRFNRNYAMISRKELGYRFLNVLVTRARKKVVLINSIPKSVYANYEVELANPGTWSRGLLHAYITFVELHSKGDAKGFNQLLSKLKETGLSQTQVIDAHFDSPFEEEVYATLRTRFKEEEITIQDDQNGQGFRIDMVLRPQENPGLKIAIECDGAAFHSGWNNTYLDLHRERVLESCGYHFVRIWSKRWYTSRTAAEKELFRDIYSIIDSRSSIQAETDPWLSYTLSSFEDQEEFEYSDIEAEVDIVDEEPIPQEIDPDEVTDDSSVVLNVITGAKGLLGIRIVPNPGYVRKGNGITYLPKEMPLAKALIGQKVGAKIQFNNYEYQIKEVIQF